LQLTRYIKPEADLLLLLDRLKLRPSEQPPPKITAMQNANSQPRSDRHLARVLPTVEAPTVQFQDDRTIKPRQLDKVGHPLQPQANKLMARSFVQRGFGLVATVQASP
jgi:hypothetical protein